MKGVVISWLVLALVTGMAGCGSVPGPVTPIPDPGPSLDLEIRTWYDLDAVRDNLAGHHRLMNDLDATTDGYGELAGPEANGGKGWQPIGAWDPYDHNLYLAFSGTFDGQGYYMGDLFIDRPGDNTMGLFRYVSEGAVVKNVGLVNATVTGGHYVGGLVAHLDGTVNNCYSSGSVTGEWAVGGLVGANHGGTVSNCYSTSSVTGDRDQVGGLVGRHWGGTIDNSYATGSVTGGDFEVGGLVGASESGASVSNAFWDVETSGMEESDGGIGKTTAEMMNGVTFTDTATEGLDEPWDIAAVAANVTNPTYTWNIVDGDTYPFLVWQSVD